MLYKMSIEKGSLWLHLMTAGLRPAEACLAELRAILVNM